MFVVSMKTTRPRITAYAVVLCLLAAVTFGLAGRQDALRAGTTPTAADGAGRVAFLRQLGYEVEDQWTDVREIVIPTEFDDAFSAYNDRQKEAGYDLAPYRGERVKLYTYEVRNYPGTDRVQATLYVCRERVIAGDISSTAAEGFSHGLKPLVVGQEEPETQEKQEEQEEQGETNGTTG